MTYAPASTPIYDADSHIMELPDFLRDFADPSIRDELPQVSYSASLVSDEEVAVILDQGGKHSEAHVNEQIALGDELIAKSKEIQALGAFTRSDRTTALDMLGFKKQLVFATHSVAFPFHPSSKKTPSFAMGLLAPTTGTWRTFAKKTIVSWALASFHWMIPQEPSVSLKPLSI